MNIFKPILSFLLLSALLIGSGIRSDAGVLCCFVNAPVTYPAFTSLGEADETGGDNSISFSGALPNSGACLFVACATIATALVTWKNSSYALATTEYYFQTFMGTAANTITYNAMGSSVAPSWLVLNGGGIYALNSNLSVVSPSPYQTYYGFAAFSQP
jgi:hypothetical protein